MPVTSSTNQNMNLLNNNNGLQMENLMSSPNNNCNFLTAMPQVPIQNFTGQTNFLSNNGILQQNFSSPQQNFYPQTAQISTNAINYSQTFVCDSTKTPGGPVRYEQSFRP